MTAGHTIFAVNGAQGCGGHNMATCWDCMTYDSYDMSFQLMKKVFNPMFLRLNDLLLQAAKQIL